MINDAFAINVLARKLAIDGVKRQLKAQARYKPWLPIRKMAVEYFAEHEAELIAQATERWRAMKDEDNRKRNRVVAAGAVRS